MDYSQLVIPEVIDNGANEASESRSNMGPSKPQHPLLGMQDVSQLVPWWCQHHPTFIELPNTRPLGDIIEGVSPAFKAHGEESEGDATMIQALPSPSSLGTCLAGGGDGDGWAELGQMPGRDPWA